MTSVEFIEPMNDAEGAARAAELFKQAYGKEPAGVWAAPGRVNLIGEHTDYNAGLCLPIALPHRTYIALSPRDDTSVRVVSDLASDVIAEADLDRLEAGGVDGWAAYPVGVKRGHCAMPVSTACRVSTRHSARACRSAPA